MGTTVYERARPPASVIARSLEESSHSVFWLDDLPPAFARPRLSGEVTADLAIVGGGYTGLWTALLAKRRDPGARVVVIEARTVGWALHSLPTEGVEAAGLDRCGWIAKLVVVAVPMIRTTLSGLLILGFIGKMKVFDLIWIMTRGGPLWATETVSTYVYKRAFDWNTFDLGYPSALASVWFAVVLAGVMTLGRLFRQRDRVEY